MKSVRWQYLLIFLLVLLSFSVWFFWRKNNLHQSIPSPESSEKNEALSLDINDFPLQNSGEPGFESYLLYCRFDQINLYSNYYDAPILPDNWRVLADVTCHYNNSAGELENLYLPLHVYQPDREELLLVGTDIKPASEDLAIQLAELTVLGWYESQIETFWRGRLEPGKIIKVMATFPTAELKGNQTRGAAFETLNTDNPPYTQSDLNNFYQTGETRFFPEVNNQHYFWPVVGYSF